MATQVQFNHVDRHGNFAYRTPMETVPRVGDHVDIPTLGEFKVRKIVWLEVAGKDGEGKDIWEAHLEVRKPWSSEF